jgi:hypothetical protein
MTEPGQPKRNARLALPLPFEEAVRAALSVKPPPKPPRKKREPKQKPKSS